MVSGELAVFVFTCGGSVQYPVPACYQEYLQVIQYTAQNAGADSVVVMNHEIIFRTLFILSFIMMTGIRVYYQSKVLRDKGKIEDSRKTA